VRPASRPRVTLIGNANVDVIVRPVASLPEAGTEQRVDKIDVRLGGAAGISALTLAGLGISSRVIACVGSDPMGSFVRDVLRVRGLSVDDVAVRSGESTAVSIAFESPARDRSFLIGLGCLAGFSEELIPDDALRADAVMIGGYFLAPRLRTAPTEHLLRSAKRNGARTFFDTGWDPGGWPASTREEVCALLPLVDVFLPNLDEAVALTGTSEAEPAARALQSVSGGLVIVKLGAQGCIAVSSGGPAMRMSAPAIDVVDSIGGGDAFNAGFIAALLGGRDVMDALELAVRVGSEVVSRSSQDRYPSWSELS
jgi:sugar/nucleoside kinase (ribokinase family)